MVENQNIECQLAEMKENCQDQTFHAFHSSCHSCLILDVCASMLVICYLPYIPYAYDSTCKWKEHCRSVLFSPTPPFCQVLLSSTCSSSSLSHLWWDRHQGTVSKFLDKRKCCLCLVLKARHKVYS